MTLNQIKRMPTGCPGLDHVLAGGLPEGGSSNGTSPRAVLVRPAV